MKGVLISRVVGRVLGSGEEREKFASRAAASFSALPEPTSSPIAHLNQAANEEDEDEDDDNDEREAGADETIDQCMVCEVDLSELDEASKERHTQKCVGQLASGEQHDSVPLPEGGLFAASFFCILCDQNLSRRKILHRCWHLKRCARKNNMSTKELLQQIAPIQDLLSQASSESDLPDPPAASGDPASARNAWTVLMSKAAQQSKLSGFSLVPSSHSVSKENIPANSSTSKKRSLPTSTSSSSSHKPARAGWSGGGRGSKAVHKPFRGGGGDSYSFLPAYKKIQVGKMAVPIVVDGFQYASSTVSEYYFLTHFHSDHYVGLSGDFDCGKIYCSTITAGLVQTKLKVPVPCLVALQMNTQYTFTVGGETAEVTLFDANHCPGAVGIVFHFPSLGRWIVHTGDFRFDRDVMLRSSSVLRQLAQQGMQQINSHLTVYLDTTYCDSTYTFPSQQDVIQAVVAAMQQENQQPGTLFVFGAYTIGKERLFMSTAATLGKRVYVDKTRWKTTLCFDWPVEEQALLTTSPEGADIWVVGMHQVSFNALPGLLLKARQAGGSYRRVVGVQPTGWNHASSSPRGQPSAEGESGGTGLSMRKKGDCIIYAASYSEHSSFPELVDFIRVFKPMRVIPTVNTQPDKAQEQLALLKQASGIYESECA